jgi:ribosomal protein S12 methylthiotransferase accessory factor
LFPSLSKVDWLLQPQGGLFVSTVRARSDGATLGLITRMVDLGDISQLGVSRQTRFIRSARHERLGASGTALDEDSALFLALAEGLERYCTSLWDPQQFLTATAIDVGQDVLDLDVVPRCSIAERSHPRCALIEPSKKLPLRWVPSLSLTSGALVHVPAVMVYLNIGPLLDGERIWLPITTGCAVHATYENALVNGILEVVERDALSLAWLQSLSLPRINLDTLPPPLSEYWASYEGGFRGTEYLFFDATTDLGIPTVLGLRICPTDRSATTLVACAADLNPAAAVAKVIRDLTAIAISFRRPREIPSAWDDFTQVFDGAAYMAHAERSQAFNFLINSKSTRSLSEMNDLTDKNDPSGLHVVLRRLRDLNIEAYAIDLSTDECIRSDLRAVRVLLPAMQPLSFHYRARYLGHQRLYEGPKRMGHSVRLENELNKWPLPFA